MNRPIPPGRQPGDETSREDPRPNRCARCASLLPARALDGLCPRCVGRRMLAPASIPMTGLNSANDDDTGTKLGHYRLARRLGEGGCGIVYLAEQEEPVRRRVALKIIKPGMDTRAVLARFEAEQQALAMMDHPNIARVLEAGTGPSGRPYFVMEWVPGVRITDFCAQHRLPLAARLELFITVCHAVQHAHQKGVIHRDLKPSNILVAPSDRGPEPKVIDFGIAKAVGTRLSDATSLTEPTQFLGTPAYMSPEQLGGGGRDVDTRTDIYSLGVTLYELLTGTTPFDPRDFPPGSSDTLRRAILETEPVRPTRRSGRAGPGSATGLGALPEELDWIVMKCLEQDPSRRYATANGLAEDLRRHLAHEPVTAAAPGIAYQLGKLARRHRAAFAGTAVVTVALLAATGISAWQAIRISAAEAAVRERLKESEAARREAEAVSKFLTDILRSPSPAQSGRAVTVVEMLDHTTRSIEADPALPPARRARLLSTLGATYRSLGHYRESIALFEKALEHHRATSGPEHDDTLDAKRDLATAYHDASRHDDALKLCEEIVNTRLRLHGPRAPGTLRAQSHLAWSHHARRHNQTAIEIEERVLAASREENGAEHPDTIQALSYLGWFYSADKRPVDALPLQTQSLESLRRRIGPEHPETLNAMTALSATLIALNQPGRAIELLGPAIPVSQRVKGASHPETLWAAGILADAQGAAGQRAEATRMYGEILRLSTEANGTNHGRTRWAQRKLAESLEAARETPADPDPVPER